MRQLPPALDPASPDAPEASEQTPRSLAGPLPREATPLDPAPRREADHGNHGSRPADEHDHAGTAGQAETKPPAIYNCPMHPEVRQDRPGSCPKCGMSLVPKDDSASRANAPPSGGHSHHAPSKDQPATEAPMKDTYTCPMHPEVRQDKPGNCPKCGMKLVPVKKAPPPGEHGGHH